MDHIARVQVEEGGRIVLSFPDLKSGQVVEVQVKEVGSGNQHPLYGLYRGKIKISSDFDSPIPEMEDPQ